MARPKSVNSYHHVTDGTNPKNLYKKRQPKHRVIDSRSHKPGSLHFTVKPISLSFLQLPSRAAKSPHLFPPPVHFFRSSSVALHLPTNIESTSNLTLVFVTVPLEKPNNLQTMVAPLVLSQKLCPQIGWYRPSNNSSGTNALSSSTARPL